MNMETTLASTTRTPVGVLETRRNGIPELKDKTVTTRTLAQVVSMLRDDATESDGFEPRRRTREDRPRGVKEKPSHIIGSRPADAGNGLPPDTAVIELAAFSYPACRPTHLRQLFSVIFWVVAMFCYQVQNLVAKLILW